MIHKGLRVVVFWICFGIGISGCTRLKKPQARAFTYTISQTGMQQSDTYYYSDDYFSHDSTRENTHLRTMALHLSLAATTAAGDDPSAHITSLLTEMGFNDQGDLAVYGYDSQKADNIACAIAHKTINHQDVVIVAMRGDGYKVEWASNLKIGAEKNAQGFSDMADVMVHRLKNYLTTNHLSQHVKILISGYSRAGAVADLMGVYLNTHLSDFHLASEKSLYIYTFGAPQPSYDAAVYQNIHIVRRRDDIVPYLLNAAWHLYGNGVMEDVTRDEEKIVLRVLKDATQQADTWQEMLVPLDDGSEISLSSFLSDLTCYLTTGESDLLPDRQSAFQGIERKTYALVLQPYVVALSEKYYKKTSSQRLAVQSFVLGDVFPLIFSQKEAIIELVKQPEDLSQRKALSAIFQKAYKKARQHNKTVPLKNKEHALIVQMLADEDVCALIGDLLANDTQCLYAATFFAYQDIIMTQHGALSYAQDVKALDSYYAS